MRKPEDIPQYVWDAAAAAYEAMPLVYDGWNETEVVSCIARAILAAKAEEREACALVAAAEELTGAPPPHITPEQIMLANATVRATAKSIAAAIRKRGEG